MDRIALLKKGISLLGLPVEESIIEKMIVYINEITLWNSGPGKNKPGVRLLGGGSQEIIIQHTLDSLAGLEVFRRYTPGTIADIGSGAGFPGIPLSFFLKDSKITLVERSGRKAAFLRSAAAVLSQGNVNVLEADFKGIKKQYDAVTFRAFGKLDEICPDIFPLLHPRGKIFAYKGTSESADKECENLRNCCGGELEVRIYPLEVPFLKEERHLILIQK